MLNNMQPGSIIYDLAAIQGGNTSASKVNQMVDYNGVKILGGKYFKQIANFSIKFICKKFI